MSKLEEEKEDSESDSEDEGNQNVFYKPSELIVSCNLKLFIPSSLNPKVLSESGLEATEKLILSTSMKIKLKF